MDKIIVYLDDAEYARHLLTPMDGPIPRGGQATHWVLVACPPHMTRHISKWVSHKARQNWRSKWAEKLFAQITPEFVARGHTVTAVLAHGPLVEMSSALQKQHGAARVLDARRPKFGHELPPVTPDQPPIHEAGWTIPGAIAGMGAVLALTGD